MEEWRSTLGGGGRVEIGLARGRLWWLLLASAVLVAGCLYLALTAASVGGQVIGWAGVVLFGLGLLIFPRQLAQRGPAVVVDDQGIAVPAQGVLVPWSAALGASVFRSQRTRLVQIAATPEFMESYYADHRRIAAMRAINARVTGAESVSLPTPLAAPAEEVAAWLSEEIQRRKPTDQP